MLHRSRTGADSFWGGAQPRGEQMGGQERFAVTGAVRDHNHDVASTDACFQDIVQSLFDAQGTADIPNVADLVIRCLKWDLVLPLELSTNVTVEGLQIGLSCQKEVSPMLR